MSKPVQPETIDFDQWAALADQDPHAFEKERARLLAGAIDEAPPAVRQRLRGLQWQVDQIRGLSRTPLSACIKISRMMWNTALGPGGLVDILQGSWTGPCRREKAGVLRFPERRRAQGLSPLS